MLYNRRFVVIARAFLPELNENSQIRQCHNTTWWQAENVRPFCSVILWSIIARVSLGLERLLPSDESTNHKHSSHRNYRVDKHASSSFAPI